MKCVYSQECNFDFGESLFASIVIPIVIPRKNERALLMEPSVANSLVKKAKDTLWTPSSKIIVLVVSMVYICIISCIAWQLAQIVL